MPRTKTSSDVKKRGNRTDPAKANPRDSQAGRLPGHGQKGAASSRQDNPTMARPSTQPVDRNRPAIRPNIGRTDCADLDQLIVKAKSQIARINKRERYVTARHWDFAGTLEQIRNICTKKGDWERALKRIGLRRQTPRVFRPHGFAGNSCRRR